MILTQLYAYGAVLMAILFIIGIFRWRRSGASELRAFRGFRGSTVDEAFNRWLIEGISSGRVDLSDLISTDEEITIGGIRFKGEIKIKDLQNPAAQQDPTRPIVKLRNTSLEELDEK